MEQNNVLKEEHRVSELYKDLPDDLRKKELEGMLRWLRGRNKEYREKLKRNHSTCAELQIEISLLMTKALLHKTYDECGPEPIAPAVLQRYASLFARLKREGKLVSAQTALRPHKQPKHTQPKSNP